MKANLTLMQNNICVVLTSAKVSKVDDFIVSVDYDIEFVTKEMINNMIELGCSITFYETEIHVCAKRKIVNRIEFI